MDKLHNTRRDNFALLEDHFGAQLLTQILGYKRDIMSKLRTGSRIITDERARYIEIKTRMDKNWLDSEHPEGVLASERKVDKAHIDALVKELSSSLRQLPVEIQLEVLQTLLPRKPE